PFITGLRYYFLEAAKEELQKEIFAQFDKFFSSGLKISHIDGHLHMHMHPTVFSILIEAATKYGVKHIRLPREPLIHTLKLRRRNLFNKLLWWTVFHLLSKSAVSRIEGRGFITPKTVYGLLESGAMTEDFVLGLLQQISSVTTELYCHPELYTPETENRLGEEEMMALLSSKVKKLLQERNIHLGTYADL
ncbi:MAG: ChbG/HpnK family deacetylase, partial [Blastocatellia bacterium]|nr:ChbG/HpnK family deacetylase [Blastocatellia bacterium]